jgi:hypothetical protein
MRTLITSLVILVFSTCILFAPNMVTRGEEQEKGPVNQMGITIKLPPMMSNIVQDILTKASSLDLSDSQEKELSAILEKYVFPMIRNERDFKIYHMKVNDIFLDPNFDPNKVKTEMKVLQEFSIKEINMAIDAIAAIRNVIGVEKFKAVMAMMALKNRGVNRIETTDGEQER